jgi:3'(2'), 5'-bisphosphate nucleotidase
MNHELRTALEAARAAANICTQVYASLVEAAAKTGREPVTVADYASQTIINALLRQRFPDDAILGEEHADEFESVLNAEQRTQVVGFANQALGGGLSEAEVKAILTPPQTASARQWIIDPIDGTKGFLGKRAYAVALALMEGETLKLGVLACPNLSLDKPGELSDEGVLFYAYAGAGAYRIPLSGGEAVQMRVSSATPHDPLVIATSYEKEHSDKGLFNQVVDSLPSPEKQSIGMDGQGKYGLVADGRVMCYFRLVPDPAYREKVWDHAAGTLIVQEAGGRVSDFHGKPLDFSRGRKLADNRGILVSNGILHDVLLGSIAKTGWDRV